MFGARAIQRRREKEEELKVDSGLEKELLDTRSAQFKKQAKHKQSLTDKQTDT